MVLGALCSFAAIREGISLPKDKTNCLVFVSKLVCVERWDFCMYGKGRHSLSSGLFIISLGTAPVLPPVVPVGCGVARR